MTEEIREFKGIWIPKEIWLDKRLSALDKIVLMEIDSLDNTQNGCYASNKHIAEFCQCSEPTVTRTIAKLEQFGYLYVYRYGGRHRAIKTNIEKNDNLIKMISQTNQNDQAASSKRLASNNREKYIEDINKKENIKRKREKSDFDKILSDIKDDELKELYCEYIKMRKLIKAPMTDRALTMLIKKVNELEPVSISRQKQLLETAIINNWKSVYPLKEDKAQKQYNREQGQQGTGNMFLDMLIEEGYIDGQG